MTNKVPQFKENEDVYFEVAPDGINPRWLLNIDKGYTGMWAEGFITEITNTSITIDALFPNQDIRRVTFPNKGSSDYDPGQWWYPGYLTQKNIKTPRCDCGHGDGSGIHWNFCKTKAKKK